MNMATYGVPSLPSLLIPFQKIVNTLLDMKPFWQHDGIQLV